MKKILNWMIAAILICGTVIFTACSKDEDTPLNKTGIAMIVKSGNIDYFRQIETSFRSDGSTYTESVVLKKQ